MSLASGTQLHRHEAWMVKPSGGWWFSMGFLCQKRLQVVEQQWDKPWNVLKCWEMGYDCSQLLGLYHAYWIYFVFMGYEMGIYKWDIII
jgi:hypothetical protein